MRIIISVLAVVFGAAMASVSAEPLTSSRTRIDTDYQADAAVCKELSKSEIPACMKEAIAKKKAAYASLWKNRDPAAQTRVYYGDLNTNKPKIEKDYQADIAFCRELDKAGSATCQREALERKKFALKSVMTAPKDMKAVCPTCGLVTQVREVDKPRQGSLIGQIGGGVVGGVLGNQVGGGNGRTAATIVGALGGALAGNEIEKRVKTNKYYEVGFRLNNGEEKTITFESENHGFKTGDKIKFENNQLIHQQ
ncbi:MAG: glycine zipper 2TM domain-containing protein [Formivibrio sp.]|nr:glycine zipper 2TM domain-containing protein [Formivibrio sp.]